MYSSEGKPVVLPRANKGHGESITARRKAYQGVCQSVGEHDRGRRAAFFSLSELPKTFAQAAGLYRLEYYSQIAAPRARFPRTRQAIPPPPPASSCATAAAPFPLVNSRSASGAADMRARSMLDLDFHGLARASIRRRRTGLGPSCGRRRRRRELHRLRRGALRTRRGGAAGC